MFFKNNLQLYLLSYVICVEQRMFALAFSKKLNGPTRATYWAIEVINKSEIGSTAFKIGHEAKGARAGSTTILMHACQSRISLIFRECIMCMHFTAEAIAGIALVSSSIHHRPVSIACQVDPGGPTIWMRVHPHTLFVDNLILQITRGKFKTPRQHN